MRQQSRFRISLGIIALVFVALLVYSTAPRIVQAATGGFTQTQAYSSNFSTVALPTDGTTQATLTKIPFTVSAKGKVEVTTIFALLVYDPANPGGCEGCKVGSITCSILLDSTHITSLSDVFNSYNDAPWEYSMTTTAALTSGSHTLALQCIGLLNPNYTNFVMQATGRGMSAIVLY